MKELKTGYPVQIGNFTEGNALVIIPAEGSTKIHEYMDGTKELRLSFEINIKSKSQEEAFNILSDVINNIQYLGDFLDDGPLLNIIVEQMPYFANEQTIGYFIYNSKIAVEIIETK
jgi:hypothetical protein